MDSLLCIFVFVLFHLQVFTWHAALLEKVLRNI